MNLLFAAVIGFLMGAVLASVNVTYVQWEFYAVFALMILYGVVIP